MSSLGDKTDSLKVSVSRIKDEARKQGSTRYFTGKPCINGHLCERMVSNGACYECLQLQNKARIAKRPKEHATKKAVYYRDNIEARKAQSRAWRADNKDRLREQQSRWRRNNRDKANARKGRHRALEFRATPSWADHALMGAVYLGAQEVSIRTGISHHVDHIVPLSSRWVCGLHNHHNLQVLQGSANSSKANRYWPDMFERAE